MNGWMDEFVYESMNECVGINEWMNEQMNE